MRSFVQVLTTPTADTPGTTLLLHFDNKRYLIGSMAEGTQRASVQMGARLLKVSQCFITGRTEWSNVGGLIGMILTLADASASSQESFVNDLLKQARSKAKREGWLDDEERLRQMEDDAINESKKFSLAFFGPPNLNHLLATARRFVFRKGMPVHVHEILEEHGQQEGDEEWAPYWADDNIKVWPLSISPSSVGDGASMNGNSPPRPRKRTIDEVNEGRPDTADEPSQKQRDLLTTKAVVSEMFDSSWRLDTLYETPLSQVNLPASIFIRDAETNKIERYNGPLPGGSEELLDPDLPVLVRRPWPGALIESLPHTEPAKEAISYIFRGHTQRGKFRPEKAKALNVEMGHKWASLSAGKSVQSKDGKTVTPDMVLGESKDASGFCVIDLPDPSYIEKLINRPEWREDTLMSNIGAMFWICGPGVASDSRVQGFMRQFASLEHIVSSLDFCTNSISFDSAATSTIRMRKIDPTRFNIPFHEEVSTRLNGGPFEDANLHVAERGQVVQVEPSLQFQEDQVVQPILISQIEGEMSSAVMSEAELAHDAIKTEEEQTSAWSSTIPDREAEVITLGTGSALPSKYRNVSSTLLRVPGWGCVLFDAGENTMGQLKRAFPPEEVKQILHDLRMIFISHMHADHHLGTASVIRSWYYEVHNGKPLPPLPPDTNVRDLLRGHKRLAVVSEPAMQQWLYEYASVEDYGFSHIAPLHISPAFPWNGPYSELTWFTPESETHPPTTEPDVDHQQQNKIPPSLLELTDIQAVEVQHCHGARAVSITFPSGFKASYSGDCRPSKRFTKIGKGSTVCIHEATFDDELQGDAEAKNHSTMSEALDIAQSMGAKTCVLTHFSQRYQKMPVFEHAWNEGGAVIDSNAHAALSQSSEDSANVVAERGKANANINVHPAGPIDHSTAQQTPTLFDQPPADDTGWKGHLPHSHPTATSENDQALGAAASAPENNSIVKFRLTSDMKVCVAFDYMRVKVGEIPQMEKFTPALVRLFAEDEARDAARKAKVTAELEIEKNLKRGKKGSSQDAEQKEKQKSIQKETQKEDRRNRRRMKKHEGQMVEQKEESPKKQNGQEEE